MKLQISFEPDINESQNSRLVLSVGDISVRSYPMSADDQYRDLVAIRHFLTQRTLSSIFFGDEPVAGLEFSRESNLVKLTPYGGPGEKSMSREFDLSQGLSHIGRVLDELAAMTKTEKGSLERQVAADVDEGVYDIYLSNRLAGG